jgi:localization factor PodJL
MREFTLCEPVRPMATTIHPEIPWNVAGIAPEAREAARASARREGLSVGEWLTRRILHRLSQNGAGADEWWLAETSPARTPSNENPAHDGIRRPENRAVETQRHDHGAGSISRNGGAVRGATAIKVAPPTEPENFERLNGRLVRLDARVARVEIRAAAEDAKHAETVKTLQASVAELADRVSRAASKSAMQDTQLARAIEAVAGKVVQSSAAVHERDDVMNERISAITEKTGSISEMLEEYRWENERQFGAAAERAAAMEFTVERHAQDRDAIDRLGGSVDELTRRFDTAEAEYLNNVERFETRLTRVEADSGEAVIDRLQGIEATLADMAKLLEKNGRDDEVRGLDQVKSEERRSPADVQENSGSATIAEAVEPASGHVEADTPASESAGAAPILDLPPFPEKAKKRFAPDAITGSSPYDLRAPLQSASGAGDSATRPITAELESFLAAARRNARVAETSAATRSTSFSWVDPAPDQASQATHTRLILLGGIGLLALSAIGTGLYLSNNWSQTAPVPLPTAGAANPPTIVSVQKPVAARAPAAAAQSVATPAPDVRTPQAAVEKAPHLDQAPAVPRSHTVFEPKRLLPATAAARTPTTPLRTKPLTPLQRLAALANTGNAKAQEVLGLEYVDGDGVPENEAEGARWLERSAARGEAVAAYRLGTMYERGHGVAADPAKATQWYAVAAKAGNRKAMHNLAVAYAQGSGVQKNLLLAAQWFSRAANLGLPDSQFNLAVLYERGFGVQQSLAEAYKWYAIAAGQGDAESRARMEAIASQLSAEEKQAAEKSAAAFQPAPLDRAANAPPIEASLTGAG